MLTVWGRKSSSNVQAVLWCIEELELPHKQIDAGLSYGVTDTDEYAALNPNRTVPTLKDGSDEPIWESAAILRYLAGRYAPAAFWPSDMQTRAQVDKWAEWAKVNIATKFTGPLFWAVARTPKSHQNPATIAAAGKVLDFYLDIADAQLSQHTYLAGDNLTLADIPFGHVLYRYFDIDIERQHRQHLQRYYENLSQRPQYQKTVMVSYEELVDTL